MQVILHFLKQVLFLPPNQVERMSGKSCNFVATIISLSIMDNKKLTEHLSRRLKRSRTDINKLMEAFTGVVATRCGEMDSIAIPSFGTFEPRKRNERVMTNPATGKRMLVPPKITLSFKVSNVLKNKFKS